MFRIPLHVTGVNLSHPETLAAIGGQLDDIVWSQVGGRVLAVVYTEKDPVGKAHEAARRIRNKLGASVHEVDQDLVNVSDIAHRIGFTREAVRNWAEAKRGPGNFPVHVGTPGIGDDQKVWRWGDVAEWLRTHYGLGDAESSLSSDLILRINSALQDHTVSEHVDHEQVLTFEAIDKVLQAHEPSGIPLDHSVPTHVAHQLKTSVRSDVFAMTWEENRQIVPPRPRARKATSQ